MTLLEQIRSDQLQARKSRDQLKASLLTTLIGDAVMIGKNDGNRESTDEEVRRVIKKFVTNATESANAVMFLSDTTSRDRYINSKAEIDILSAYLPTQMNEATLEFVITHLIVDLNASSSKDMGKIMKALKEKHGGTYDGATANALVKKMLERLSK